LNGIRKKERKKEKRKKERSNTKRVKKINTNENLKNNSPHLEALPPWKRCEVCSPSLCQPTLRRCQVGLLPEFVQDKNAPPV
jgi:hypothetical protein